MTSGGENIPPYVIETSIKDQLPMVLENVMVIGDRKKFLSSLLTLKVGTTTVGICNNLPL